MPTCGECLLLAKNRSGDTYTCVAKLANCSIEKLTPQSDASHCIRFARKQPK